MGWTSEDIANVETAIRSKISGGAVRSYSVGGRSLQHMTLDELRALRAEMKREVNAAGRTTRAGLRYMGR